MDIFAPILAYLTCVAGIVGAFVVSFVVVFSTPNQPVPPQHNAAVVSASATLAEAKNPAVKNGQADKLAVNYAVNTTQKREPAPQAAATPIATPAQGAAAQKLAAIDTHQKSKISRAQWRQMVQQERSHRLASDFETRFLGYAD
jgi:LmbE family N-acetylglucosaminyl deacetylase